MTSLDPDPLIVSLLQVADTLPMFLFALPAGRPRRHHRQAQVSHCRRDAHNSVMCDICRARFARPCHSQSTIALHIFDWRRRRADGSSLAIDRASARSKEASATCYRGE